MTSEPKIQLKDLTKIIYEKLCELKEISIKDFASYIISQCSISISENSFRRRIYDVISILTSLGYVNKVDGTLQWIGKSSSEPKPPEYLETRERIEAKRERLKYQARTLLLCKVCIRENMRGQRVNQDKRIYFPFVFFECSNNSMQIKSRTDNKIVAVITDKDIIILSPFDIMGDIPFRVSTVLEVINDSPELKDCLDVLDLDLNGKSGNDFIYI